MTQHSSDNSAAPWLPPTTTPNGRAPAPAATRLARQVEERLHLVFAGEVADPDLESLTLLHVVPSRSGRLVVSFEVDFDAEDAPTADDIHAALDRIRGWLRNEVAQAIHRRRTPDLEFRLVDARQSAAG